MNRRSLFKMFGAALIPAPVMALAPKAQALSFTVQESVGYTIADPDAFRLIEIAMCREIEREEDAAFLEACDAAVKNGRPISRPTIKLPQ